MKFSHLGLAAAVALLFCSVVHAGRVRTLYANDRVMQPIFLTMGRSTVLRFDEKPKSAVVGNQNYFSLEYIGNDITIQPQGSTITNLFVYTSYQTYGLILQVGSPAQYDDLVYVRFKPGYVNVSDNALKKHALISSVPIGRSLEIKNALKLDIKRAAQSVAQGVWIFEVELENLSKEKLKVSEVQIKVVGADKIQSYQKAVFEKEVIDSHESTQGRMILRAYRVDGADIAAWYQGKEQKITLERRFFR